MLWRSRQVVETPHALLNTSTNTSNNAAAAAPVFNGVSPTISTSDGNSGGGGVASSSDETYERSAARDIYPPSSPQQLSSPGRSSINSSPHPNLPISLISRIFDVEIPEPTLPQGDWSAPTPRESSSDLPPEFQPIESPTPRRPVSPATWSGFGRLTTQDLQQTAGAGLDDAMSYLFRAAFRR